MREVSWKLWVMAHLAEQGHHRGEVQPHISRVSGAEQNQCWEPGSDTALGLPVRHVGTKAVGVWVSEKVDPRPPPSHCHAALKVAHISHSPALGRVNLKRNLSFDLRGNITVLNNILISAKRVFKLQIFSKLYKCKCWNMFLKILCECYRTFFKECSERFLCSSVEIKQVILIFADVYAIVHQLKDVFPQTVWWIIS